jgi:F0F1-type ATP synthase membrane subunit b/b'
VKQTQEKLSRELQEKFQAEIKGFREEVQVIKEGVQNQVAEIERISNECQNSCERLRKEFSSELAAEVSQVKKEISKNEEKRERQLIGIKGKWKEIRKNKGRL